MEPHTMTLGVAHTDIAVFSSIALVSSSVIEMSRESLLDADLKEIKRLADFLEISSRGLFRQLLK